MAGVVTVVAAFMVVAEGVFTAGEVGPFIPVEASHAVDQRLRVLAIRAELQALLPAPLAIRSADTRAWEIPRIHVQRLPVANGVRLAAHLEAGDQRRLNPGRDRQRIQEAGGTSLARIARQAQRV